jgi:serine/threonine protein kinase
VVGVLPYIAPEVINNKPYTMKADIYSLGVIMSVLSSEQQPFSNVAHNVDLVFKICNGSRPVFSNNTPKFYIELAYKCMDADPNNRPTAEDVLSHVWAWKDSFNDDLSQDCKDRFHGKSIEELKPFREEFENMDKIKFDSSKITSAAHGDASYFSRPLENYSNLPQPSNSSKVTIINSDNIDSHQIDLSIPVNFNQIF